MSRISTEVEISYAPIAPNLFRQQTLLWIVTWDTKAGVIKRKVLDKTIPGEMFVEVPHENDSPKKVKHIDADGTLRSLLPLSAIKQDDTIKWRI